MRVCVCTYLALFIHVNPFVSGSRLAAPTRLRPEISYRPNGTIQSRGLLCSGDCTVYMLLLTYMLLRYASHVEYRKPVMVSGLVPKGCSERHVTLHVPYTYRLYHLL